MELIGVLTYKIDTVVIRQFNQTTKPNRTISSISSICSETLYIIDQKI